MLCMITFIQADTLLIALIRNFWCYRKENMKLVMTNFVNRNRTTEVKPSGKIASGTTEIPFSVTLRQQGENLEKFYETFHGANISIQYLVTVDVTRGYLHKSLSTTMEFIVESDKGITDLLQRPIPPEMVIFYITQDTQRHSLLPELKSGGFRVMGKISSQCSLAGPISGELIVETSAVPIHSIDIQLFRVESILLGEKIAIETSLIQTTQASDTNLRAFEIKTMF
ncbi:hypothetical protein Ahy_A05g022822 isoform D [Arachis hypogaea]|uniref:Uncharacterized protein n=1 Tax=Arachis hypogaea TaxID=3818 RepID=A0A445D1P9_ARAHY|nr:hypothetical protein Ahy_A05g022822 isoform D [Arachis hypogaea]